MSHDIYTILENIDAAQKSVKQLPALFRPADTSPQLSGPYPGRNATLGYLVGEGEDNGEQKVKITFSPNDIEVVERALKRMPNATIFKHIVDEYEKIAGINREGDAVLNLNLSSDDLSAIESVVEKFGYGLDETGIFQHIMSELDNNNVTENKRYDHENPMAQAVTRRIINQHPEWITRYGVEFLMQVIDDVTEGEDWEEIGSSDVSAYVDMVHDQLRDRGGDRDDMADRRPFAEAQETATEDVLDTMKRRLGDYLQDVAKAIKQDPDLKDKIPQDIDQIKAVKTLKTDDGHEIKITGNEDDGFRVSIKNKQSNTKFANLDEATMAVEMFCARRRSQTESADYIDEA